MTDLSKFPRIVKNARQESLNLNTLNVYLVYEQWLLLQSLPTEVWKDIIGYEGKYQISNLGRVKSLERFEERAGYERFMSGRILKFAQYTHKSCEGYLYVVLCKNSKGKIFKIHKLVAEHFIENLSGFLQVNHINGIKIDNTRENLEWCDNKHNIKEYFKMNPHGGDCVRGSKNASAKLNEGEVKEILKLKDSLTQSQLAERFKISPTTVWHIINGKQWRHVYDDFIKFEVDKSFSRV